MTGTCGNSEFTTSETPKSGLAPDVIGKSVAVILAAGIAGYSALQAKAWYESLKLPVELPGLGWMVGLWIVFFVVFVLVWIGSDRVCAGRKFNGVLFPIILLLIVCWAVTLFQLQDFNMARYFALAITILLIIQFVITWGCCRKVAFWILLLAAWMAFVTYYTWDIIGRITAAAVSGITTALGTAATNVGTAINNAGGIGPAAQNVVGAATSYVQESGGLVPAARNLLGNAAESDWGRAATSYIEASGGLEPAARNLLNSSVVRDVASNASGAIGSTVRNVAGGLTENLGTVIH